MSTLLEQASLIMIPSGYKEDVVYSQIPTSGAGDLSFTRASNGTRVNSAGLVEVCPWNEAQQSNTFGTSPWSNTLDTGATLTYTANYGTAPDGTATAGRLQMALNGSNYVQKNQIISVITGQQYTYSVYMRSLSGTKNIIFCYDNTNNISATVTTEWQRFTATFTGNSQVYCRFVLEAGTSTSVDLLVYGAQLNIGSTAKPYFPTTDRLNVPRLTYQNGGGGCPSLLLEKQSTNMVSYSEQFDNVVYDKTGGAITANSTTSPDGTTNADSFIEDSSTGFHFLQQSFVALATSYTYTIYAKNASGTRKLVIREGISTGSFGTFDLVNGTVTNSGAGGTASIESVGNGWYRCAVTFTAVVGASTFQVFISNANTFASYTGNGTSGFYLYGAQVEASSYKTSYIPTTSASATRVADVSNTGISSSILPQASGTIFVQFDWQKTAVDCNVLSVHNNSNNLAWITKNSSTQLFGTFFMSGYIGTIQPTISASAGIIKVAYAWTSGSQTMFVNGVEVGTATGTISSSPNFNAVQLNGFWGINKDGCEIQQAVLFQTKLTNAELASLTTI